MKKTICILLTLTLLGTLLVGCGSKSEATVSVQSVSMITGYGSLGLYERYAGIVEAGSTFSVQKQEELDIGKLSVAVGDRVEAGDLLFTYDTDAIKLQLEKAQLEYDQMQNQITTKTAQIESLEKEKAKASADAQIDYTLEIQELQLDISETTVNLAAKQREIDRYQELTENAEVRAENAGRVQSINDPKSESYDASKPYITLVQTDHYRVKGNVGEQYAQSLYAGMPMLVRSRVDESVVWHGTLESVDLENPVQGSNSDYGYYVDYGGGGDELTTASKYPFYVALEDDTGLLLGQHVYLEPDVGQQDEGMYLSSAYLCDTDSAPYVWAANASDRLEKRSVTLGQYDAELDAWEITAGLSATDYIAFPDETCVVGAGVVRYDENSFDNGENAGFEFGEGDFGADNYGEGDFGEGDFVDDGVFEGAIVDDGMVEGETVPEDAAEEAGGVG